MDLTRTNFTDASLGGGASLTGSTISDADFTGARLAGMQLSEVSGTPSHLPAGWLIRSHYLLGPGVRMSGRNLSGMNLSETDLSEANLEPLGLTITDLSSANLSNSNLSSARLSFATFAGANLSGARLTNASVMNLNLAEVTLAGVVSGGLIGTPINIPSGWVLAGGYLIGAGANLQGADLRGLVLGGRDLTGANLTGANLTGANLTGANLTGVISGNIIGSPAGLPAGWALVTGKLASGPGSPKALVAVAANSRVRLTWTKPAADGGTAITSYAVTVAPTGGACSVSGLSATCAGLRNGTRYSFSVTARNVVGLGTSALVPATPRTTPGAPQNVTVTAPLSQQARISWARPLSDGGASVRRYEYCRSLCAKSASWRSAGLVGATPKRSVLLTGLVRGRTYSVQVRAVNGAGSGAVRTVTFSQRK